MLGRLSGPLCDGLRETSGSGALLEELSRRSVFTVPVEDDDGAFRYHEVLRQHLDRMLVEEVGEAEARARHARAGGVLEADGALPEALRAYCRAEDWPAVRRLLGGQGERLAAAERSAWVDAVPPAIERHDPWVALAAARRARNDGRWSTAIDGYIRAESVFGPSRAADAPRRERQRLAAWLDPVAMPTPDAIGALRSGLVREPVLGARDAARLDDPAAPVARGLLHLAAGEVVTARRHARGGRGRRRGRPDRVRRGPARCGGGGTARRGGVGRPGHGPCDRGGRAGRLAVARAARAGAGRPAGAQAGGHAGPRRDGVRRGRRAGSLGAGPARPRRGVGIGRRPGAPPGHGGGGDRAVPPAWGRRARGVGARPGGARRREPRDAGCPRGRARLGIGGSGRGIAGGTHVRVRGARRQRRSPRAPSTACSRTPSVRTPGSSCRGRPAWRRR